MGPLVEASDPLLVVAAPLKVSCVAVYETVTGCAVVNDVGS